MLSSSCIFPGNNFLRKSVGAKWAELTVPTHNFLLREPILSLFVLPARSRNFAHFCRNRFSIPVPRRPWERSQGLLYRPVRFPVPAKRFANFVTALSLLLRVPEPSWRWAATIGGGFAAFWVMPGPPPE